MGDLLAAGVIQIAVGLGRVDAFPAAVRRRREVDAFTLAVAQLDLAHRLGVGAVVLGVVFAADDLAAFDREIYAAVLGPFVDKNLCFRGIAVVLIAVRARTLKLGGIRPLPPSQYFPLQYFPVSLSDSVIPIQAS